LARARDHLLSNMVSLPGIGTFLAGHRVSGTAQMLLATAGFALSLYWFGTFLREWLRTRTFPYEGGPHFRWGLIGVGIFACAWLWAFISGLQIQRAARRTNP